MMSANNQLVVPGMSNNSMPMHQPILQPAPTIARYEDEVEMSTYLDILSENRWLIAKIVLLCTLLGLAYAMFTKPIYEASMMIHVEEEKPNTSKNILGDISSLFDIKAAAISEMELLNSRLVIARAVDSLGLYIDVHPKHFPVIGSWIAGYNREISKPGLFGYGGYTWGAEKISIAGFYVPDALQNQEFTVQTLGNNQYRLTQKKRNIDVTGTIGKPLDVKTDVGTISLRVGAIDANPGAEFRLKYTPKLAAIEDIQKSMTVAEKGKQSGIIGITLESADPKAAFDILTEIGNEYIRQNVARKLEEAEKSLAFLDKQLPDLKRSLDESEAEYFKFRNGHGTIDLPEEAKLSLQQAAMAKTKRLELQQKKEEMLVSFTPNHPLVIGINKQISEMSKELGSMNDHIKQLPILEQDLLRLNRDVKVKSDLYAALLNSAQQLRLVKAGKVSNVRLIDSPMFPENPARPNRAKIIGISILAGLLLGLAAAFFKRMLRGGIDDSRQIEEMLGARVVYANIPHSDSDAAIEKVATSKSNRIPVLANIDPGDAAIESLRAFRTSLQIALPHFKNNIVMIAGPTAGVGKSFVSVNFASVMASSGKRVLLIDSDFRIGHLHRYYGLGRNRGLSEAITGAVDIKDAIHRNVAENLDFLSTGNLPPNPAEFLLHPNFGALLKTVSANYDIVLVDPPPILAVSDALVIASHAGAVFILTRYGMTTESEINESIKRLNQAGISPQGILFNDVKVRARSYNDYHYGKPRQLKYLA
ncbi:polysaccharide biosynthesis tyrosine autokinase [soil metagenome]